MHIRKNDIVTILSGDERGKKGRVLRVVGDDRVIVEGVNFVWKHLRRSQQHPHGARIQKEAPMRASRLMLVCTACEKPAKASHTRLESGEHVRVCKKCRQTITVRT